MDFKEIIDDRIEAICKNFNVDVEYVFQALDALPEVVILSEGREKPWGTGQVILVEKDVIKEPFAVINTDDYYGKECFVKICEFLVSKAKENSLCMAGFILMNTLSDNGGVTRGICKVNEAIYLTDVVETQNIVKIMVGETVKTAVVDTLVDLESYVSMNMWGLTPEFIQVFEKGFVEFLKHLWQRILVS